MFLPQQGVTHRYPQKKKSRQAEAYYQPSPAHDPLPLLYLEKRRRPRRLADTHDGQPHLHLEKRRQVSTLHAQERESIPQKG